MPWPHLPPMELPTTRSPTDGSTIFGRADDVKMTMRDALGLQVSGGFPQKSPVWLFVSIEDGVSHCSVGRRALRRTTAPENLWPHRSGGWEDG